MRATVKKPNSDMHRIKTLIQLYREKSKGDAKEGEITSGSFYTLN